MKSMTLGQYVKNILIVFLFFFLLSGILGTKEVFLGYWLLSAVSFVTTIFACNLFLENRQAKRIILWAFFIKFVIGTAHFLVFYDPNYFQSDGSMNQFLANDFKNYYNFISYLIENRTTHSIFFFDLEYTATHVMLINLWAYFFQSFGNNVMNVVPLNCMFSSIIAISMYLAIKKYLPKNRNLVVDSCLWIVALFPLFLDNAIYVRDIVGQMFMTIGMSFLLFSNSKQRVWMILPAGFFFYLQRDAYFVAAIVFYLALAYSEGKKLKSMIIPVVALCVLYWGVSSISPDVGDEVNRKGKGISLIALPLRVFIGLVGPFPWSNFFKNLQTSPVFSSQLYNFLAGILHVGTLLCLIVKREMLLFKNPIVLLGLSLMAMGILHGDMHITYVMAGTMFIVPMVYAKYRSSFHMFVAYAFVLLFILNLLITLSGGLGLKKLV